MKALTKYGFFWLTVFSLFMSSLTVAFAAVPDRPTSSGVLDKTGLLTPMTIAQIEAENQTWAQTEEQLQIGVLFLESLSGRDLESLANETFRSWQIGFSGTNNGVLVLVALEDRAFRIETSDQAATVLTDIEAKTILDNSREFFRSEDYNGGLLYIVDAIGDHFYGTDRAQARLQEQQEASQDSSGFAELLLLLLIIGVVILFSGNSGGRGGRGGGSDLLWLLLMSQSSSSSRSRSGSSSFGGGSGGWSGGGGGGGGASSGW